MATKKQGSKSKNGRDSISKRYGYKVGLLKKVNNNNMILYGNRSSVVRPGIGTIYNKNHSIICNNKNGFFNTIKIKNKFYLFVI